MCLRIVATFRLHWFLAVYVAQGITESNNFYPSLLHSLRFQFDFDNHVQFRPGVLWCHTLRFNPQCSVHVIFQAKRYSGCRCPGSVLSNQISLIQVCNHTSPIAKFCDLWEGGPPAHDTTQIAKFMGPTWGPPGSCRPQVGPMLAPWHLLSGNISCL